MNVFVHHPLVILLTALEAFCYMMTCEMTISVGASGALFVLLGAMVSKPTFYHLCPLFANLKDIFFFQGNHHKLNFIWL